MYLSCKLLSRITFLSDETFAYIARSNTMDLFLRHRQFIVRLSVAMSLICSLAQANVVSKPVGIFSSSGAVVEEVLEHPALRGVLVRATWSSLEPTLGNFDFSEIERQLQYVREQGSQWSLAVVAGGPGSPDWLFDALGIPYVDYKFRGIYDYRLPIFWDARVQVRLAILAKALAAEYRGDSDLTLVYVPQMTSNGIEGHLQGVSMTAMQAEGYTDENWVSASKACARSFAAAFLDKAIAIEVHDINGGAEVPSRIINELWAEPGLEQRVGAAMWWLSEDTNYQSDLIDVLTAYPGDIYGQVIARSDDSDGFGVDGYAAVFEQAKTIGVRYVEPWEYEFKTGRNGANGLWNSVFADFNTWADSNYTSQVNGSRRLGPPKVEVTDDLVVFQWLGIAGQNYNIQFSPDLDEWISLDIMTAEDSNWQSLQIERNFADADLEQSAGFFRIEL